MQRLLVAGAPDLVPEQVEDLLGARLQDLRQDPAGQDARLAPADAGHLERLVLLDHRRERAAGAALDALRLGNRRAQPHGDVAREVVAADGHDAGVPQAAALEHREVGGAAADVHQRDAQLLLIGREHRLAGGQLLEHGVGHRHARAVDARDDVLGGRRGAGHDVHVDLEACAGHADRVADPVLLVHDEVLRQHVHDLAAARQRDGARGVDGAAHVLARDLAVLPRHGDHAAAVEALDVRARQAEMDRVDLDAGGQLRLLERLLDGVDGGFQVHDHTAPNAAGVGQADSDDVESAALHDLAHDGRDLRGADIEPHQISFSPCHASSVVGGRSARLARAAPGRPRSDQ